MKKTGLLNKDLSEVIAGMGHRDMLVIADAGLPIPPNVRRIDLAVSPNLPRFTTMPEPHLGQSSSVVSSGAASMAPLSVRTKGLVFLHSGYPEQARNCPFLPHLTTMGLPHLSQACSGTSGAGGLAGGGEGGAGGSATGVFSFSWSGMITRLPRRAERNASGRFWRRRCRAFVFAAC